MEKTHINVLQTVAQDTPLFWVMLGLAALIAVGEVALIALAVRKRTSGRLAIAAAVAPVLLAAAMVGDGIEQDARRAIYWYRKAAAARDRTAEYALAVATLHGRGVRKNVAAGIRQLKRVAPHFPAAMEYLAYHYAQHDRLALAKKWATRAVRRGEESARLWLAEINKRLKRRRRSRSSSRTSPPPRAS